MTDLTIQIHNKETLTLLPERAVYWPRTQTLFIADTHFGKSATFRASAIPVPGGDTDADLRRLSTALDRTGAKKLIVLGDLLHAKEGRKPDVVEAVRLWREAYAELDVMLVRGNHDQGAGDPPEEWRITCVDGPTPGPYFVLMHKPHTPEAGYGLAGHLHPAARLHGKGRQTMKLPCFWFRERVGVLPAFGSFTDGGIIRPGAGDAVYVATEQRVLTVQP
jgi:uncharacterized protein